MLRVVAYIFAFLVLPLLAAEGYLRMRSSEPIVRPLYELDPLLGWRMARGVSQRFSEEGDALVESNSLGFRDIEHSLEKDPSRLRIALLGDSFFEAKQVNLEESIVKELQREVGKCLPSAAAPTIEAAEVLNFSIQGYGTVQQYLLFREEVSAFAPDVVVLGFYEGNDVFDNHPQLNPSNPELAPYLSRQDSAVANAGELSVTTKSGSVLFFLRKALSILARYSLIARNASTGLSRLESRERILSEADYEWTLLRSPVRDEVTQAWEDTETVLKALQAEVEKHGARFFIASIPPAIVVHPDEQQRDSFRRRYAISDFRYAKNRVAALFSESQVIDLAPTLNAAVIAKGKAVYGFANSRPGYGHWNQAGHQAAAGVIAQRICDALKGK